MNPIIKLAASALPGEKKFILFAGAGVSKDAGVPTAWELMLKTAKIFYAQEKEGDISDQDVEEWFKSSKYAQLEYCELIQELYSTSSEQRNFLDKWLGSHEIGDVHRSIAELARRDIIRGIITTNFDPLLERALEEKGIRVQVISNDDDLENSEPFIQCKSFRIYKPHGTIDRGQLKNTPKDLETLSPLMEDELVRVTGEHAVLVLGYSGKDEDIVKVFKRRKNLYYPVFWVNPSKPSEKVKFIFDDDKNVFIPCKDGANKFLKEFLDLQDRIVDLAPSLDMKTTVEDLNRAITTGKDPVGPIFIDYLDGIFHELEKIQPDFSKYSELDEAIYNQIVNGERVTFRFIEAALVASRYNNRDAIFAIYEYFGHFLELYDIPENFSGSFRTEFFDGNKFLIYEMFVTFIASLIKYERWDLIGELLSKNLFIDKRDQGYVRFEKINSYVRSLDQIRNQRLELGRCTITGDLIKDRFSAGHLSKILPHKDFLEADYLLFLRSIIDEKKLWRPYSCIYFEHRVPSLMRKSVDYNFALNLLKTFNLKQISELKEKIAQHNSKFTESFSQHCWADNPLSTFNIDTIGSINNPEKS
jgi:hypothetical protein